MSKVAAEACVRLLREMRGPEHFFFNGRLKMQLRGFKKLKRPTALVIDVCASIRVRFLYLCVSESLPVGPCL